jgi:hypothetical protein
MTDSKSPDDGDDEFGYLVPLTEPTIGWRQFAHNWVETARQYASNADFWRRRVEEAGNGAVSGASLEAVKIVSDLANCDVDGWVYDSVWCFHCGSPLSYADPQQFSCDHHPDCIYGRALEWQARHLE